MKNVSEVEKVNVSDATYERYFVIITWAEVYVKRGLQELFNDLYHRWGAACEVFALETLEEANLLAIQRWPFRFFANPNLRGKTPMPLPASGTYQRKDEALERELAANALPQRYLPSYGVQQPAMQGLLAPQNNAVPMGELQGIFWSIDAMNMYASASDLNTLVSFMGDPQWIYPHALAWGDPNVAIQKAYEAYFARFYRRYSSSQECPSLSEQELRTGDSFEDVFYAEREKSRVANPVLERLVSYGVL